LNAVKSKLDFLDRLKSAIEGLHKCSACYLRTQAVEETVRGKTLWIGDVEVFALTGHPRAKICYAWSSRKRKNDKDEERVFAVLEIPPVNSPQTAVRASIVSDAKKEPWTGSFLRSNFVKYAPAVQCLRV
jgi:hypothetical protein